MRWEDQSETRKLPPAHAFLEKLGLPDSVRITRLGNTHPRVVITAACFDKIMLHLGSSGSELGGLLVGQAFGGLNGTPAPQFVVARQSVASTAFDSTGVSLRMETEVWDLARPLLGPDAVIVGWYHSHPDLGVFFSETDRATQKNFFRQDFSIGIVVDPVRRQLKAFLGPDCMEIPAGNVIIYENG